MSVGWIVVSFFTMFVALSMAEIVSSIPTAGGPYYWAAMLAPAKHSAFAAWITGWYVILSSPELPSLTHSTGSISSAKSLSQLVFLSVSQV
jgi:amino acid transporter